MNNNQRKTKYQEKYEKEFPKNWFKYCKDPLEEIEGWEKMLNDTSGQRWEIHHRDEIQDDVVVTRDELKSRGDLYNLPANKLIFLTESEHKSKHSSTRTGEKHQYWGKQLSVEHKKKISDNSWMRGRTGDKNPMYGKTGALCPNSKPIEIDGVPYVSRKAAADAHDVSTGTIGNWLREGRARYI